MEYYSVIKKNEPAWTDLDSIVPSQSDKEWQVYDIALM